MKPALLINCPINDEGRNTLSEKYSLHFIEQVEDRDAFLEKVAPIVRGIVTRGPRLIDSKLIRSMPNLEIICNISAGLGAIDLEAARAHNVIVTNGSGANAPSVADHAIGLLLAVSRRTLQNDDLMRANLANEFIDRIRTDTIYGKTMGILGLGAIGTEVAKRASAFDMEILYHNRNKRSDVPFHYCSSLMELADKSYYLVISCPGGDETYHIVDREILEALGSKGIVVNVARGSIVDTGALVQALEKGRIGGAGLDVVQGNEEERKALCRMENVVLTPHVSGYTHESVKRQNALICDIVKAHFTGRPVMNRIV